MWIIQEILKKNGRIWRDQLPDRREDWYAFSQFGTSEGKLFVGSQTEWTGFSEERPFRECRAPRLVHPARWREGISRIHELPITVRDETSLFAWMILGGEALVESSVMKQYLPTWLEPYECGRIAGQDGWISTQSVAKSALNHAPTPAIRAKVLLRDGRKCRLCGRSPDEDPHAFLEAHHGVPWGAFQSGLTVLENLFTLCNTCHRGITGGMERDFLVSINANELVSTDVERIQYFEGVLCYRNAIKDLFINILSKA